MNIETSKVNSAKNTQNAQQNASSQNNNNSSINFLDELDVLKVNQAVESIEEVEGANLPEQNSTEKSDNVKIATQGEVPIDALKVQLNIHTKRNNIEIKPEVQVNSNDEDIANNVDFAPVDEIVSLEHNLAELVQNKLNKENQVDKTNSNPFDVTKGEVQNAVNDENINNVEPNGLINDELKPEVQLEVKPIVQPEIKPEVKPELKPEFRPEVQLEAKPIVQPEIKPEVKPELKPELNPEVQMEAKPIVQPEIKPEVKPELKPEVQPEVQLEAKPIVQPEIKPEVKPELNPELNPEVQMEAKPIVQPEIKPEVKPELKPEFQPEVQMEAKPIVQPEIKPEVKPELKPEFQPEVQLETKPIVQPEIKPEVKPELKPEVQPEVQMEAKPIVQPEVKLENTEKVQEEQSIEKEPIQNNLKNDVQAPIVEELLPIDNAVNGLNNIVQELNKKMTLNQSEEIIEKPIKNVISFDDEEKEGDELINNDINIQENKEIQPQLSANMSFNSDGQPFSSFMENEKDEKKSQSILGNSAKDLAEEAAILSTMAENVAIANKNNIAKAKPVEKTPEVQKTSPLAEIFDETVEPEVKTVTREDGIKKVDVKSGVTVENVVKFDNVIMNEADVEVFINLVQNGQVDMSNLAPEAAQKSVQVSKSLADMLAKAMDSQQPVRIDFDNDISVIIRISRDGKVSAEFLPSSQIAEAYLKENLPLLRQKFDDNNIKYDDLSQRNQRDREKENNNRKKGRNDE